MYFSLPLTLFQADIIRWAQYYRLFNSAADVYSLISVQDSASSLSPSPIFS